VQQAIVAEPANTNMLVLAGPGSGKTRVVAHRCAYLLRVERVRADRILVACFNRHAALQLRRQIFRLVGKDAYGVMIQTYHGLALRLLGRSFGGLGDGEEPPDFSRLLEDATALLVGKSDGGGFRAEETRDRILAGFSHILVDEYQDVDEGEYAFISAIAGRRESDEDRKLTIMAVGDDDQSIYGFKGAHVRFIRRFQQDYQAREHYLTENYRSTKAVIAAANRLIANNTERMKIAHEIRVNRGRNADPNGGRWELLDPVVRGKVQRVIVSDAIGQASFVAGEIRRMQSLDTKIGIGSFAVLARTRDELVTIRSALDDVNIPVDWRADEEMPVSPFKIREVHAFLSLLDDHKHESWSAATIRSRIDALRGTPEINRWWRFLDEIWSEWAGESGEIDVPITLVRDFFVEAIAERRRHHRTGEGVVLVTAHKAKGLEFPHVIIADGGWRPAADPVGVEEERRVFYVAMTRAMETLSVMVRRDQRTPFSKEIAGADVIDRTPREVELASSGIHVGRRYAIIDPTELFLSYAASMTATSDVYLAIKALSVGDPVRLVPQGKWIHVENLAGIPIAALSESGRGKWAARIPFIRSAAVTAMVRRTAEQESEAYRDKALVAAWEYPIVEVSWVEQ
jgi:ATP-dependent DNA helicase RecQ